MIEELEKRLGGSHTCKVCGRAVINGMECSHEEPEHRKVKKMKISSCRKLTWKKRFEVLFTGIITMHQEIEIDDIKRITILEAPLYTTVEGQIPTKKLKVKAF
jgi:hypothetical protein